MDSEVRLRFLGTRAIHAGPGRDKVLYGGNSSCIVLEDETSTIIFNAGFGINPLGDELIRKSMASKLPVDCHILLSDYLWDNVQGLPFFTPIHFKSSRIHIHTANPIGETQLWLNTFMDPNYSPFDGLVSMRAHLCYPAADGPRAIGDWTATVLATKHPLAPYQAGIWRLEHQKGLSIGVVMTAAVDDAERQHRTDFLKGVHILIHSAIAPAISHPTMGGRATFHEAVDFGTAIGAEHTYITGYHPSFSDRTLQKAELTLAHTMGLTYGKEFSLAREWASISLPANITLKQAS